MSRILTGIKPTADLHLGNYAGSLKPCIDFSKDKKNEVFLMCADWHGLTDRAKILEPGKFTPGVLASIITLGYEIKGNALFMQSHFPEIQEIAWSLSCVSGVGLLERAHAYKDALQSGKKPTAGLFYYPILMASDIVTFDSDQVPVGKDQAQHLEYMTDMVELFNNAVGKNVLKAAKPLIQETPLLVGIDGEKKMSKSYDNHIPLFGEPKDVEKRIKGIKTDSKGLNDPKDPETCPVYQILKGFGSESAILHMKEKLEKGTGYGYGHAKQDLHQEYEKVFGSLREKYNHYCNSPKEMWSLMEPSYEKLHQVAQSVKKRVTEALGLFRV